MQLFTNDTIDIPALPKYEVVELHKPHSNYWKIIVINLLIFLGIIGIGAIVLTLTLVEYRAEAKFIIGIYSALTLILFLFFRLSFKNKGYAFRAHDVMYKSGIIVESTTIVPLNRIQHIELNQGVFSRMYQLGTLQIFTAGGQTGHIRISGIPIDEAKSLRDMILKKLDLIENQITKNAE